MKIKLIFDPLDMWNIKERAESIMLSKDKSQFELRCQYEKLRDLDADIFLVVKDDRKALLQNLPDIQARVVSEDLVLFYHSNEGLEVTGVAKVTKEAYQDPTTDDPRWVVVDLEPVETLKKPVSLDEIKKDKRLKNIALIKQSRLSVMPLTKEEFEVIVAKGRG